LVVLGVFLVLVFVYSLVARRLENNFLTGPIIFTTAGILLVRYLPNREIYVVEESWFLLVAEIALVLLLFTEASKVGLQSVSNRLDLPARLLIFSMPLTILVGTLVAAWLLPGTDSIWEAAILATILAPTDAGLGQVVVENLKVPSRIRQALSVEAGLNDGLSVPFLTLFIALAVFEGEVGGAPFWRFTLEQIGFGFLVGLLVGAVGGWLVAWTKARQWISFSLAQLSLPALALLSWLLAQAVGGNGFIAAFVAGLAIRLTFQEVKSISLEFGEATGQLLNLAVFFLFGILAHDKFSLFTPALGLYAVLSLTVIRMVPVAIGMLGTNLNPATVLFMGWFGPRGLASIVLGLVYLEFSAELPGEPAIVATGFLTVLLSIYAHGFSALPGVAAYARRLAQLPPSAPEFEEVTDWAGPDNAGKKAE
jgi:NhaP-type Na+/H+ or K+/H+ antiporter